MANKYAAPNLGRDLIGTFSYDSTTEDADLPTRYDVALNSLGANNLGAYSCRDGIADVAEARMYMTQSSGAIVHTGRDTPADKTDDNFIVAMQTQDLSSLTTPIDDEYIGLVFETTTAGGDNLFPVYVNLTGVTGTGQEIASYETNALDPGTVTINYTGGALGLDIPSDGFVNTTVDGSDLHCMANSNINGSGKNFLYCVGENPGEAGKLYNLLLSK